MSKDLLYYYNQELAFIRQLGKEFAKEHPKIAGRLRLGPGEIEDPHVSRLIEAFAFLNARTRQKLDDDFPEISEALLRILYPHYLAPIPSASIVQFEASDDLTAGYDIPRHTMLETDPSYDASCKFRTCYPLTIWPICVSKAELTAQPFSGPVFPPQDLYQKGKKISNIAASLRLVLSCLSEETTLANLAPDKLRFFLNAPTPHVYSLYELIINNTVKIALSCPSDDSSPVFLDKVNIRPVGFEEDEGLIPYPKHSFMGYRFLTEFFIFPEKFLFFELTGLDKNTLKNFTDSVEVFLYFNKTEKELEGKITADYFLLGCTPILNLFKHHAEPIQIAHDDFEYHVIPDSRKTQSIEIHSVDKVTGKLEDGGEIDYLPFYGIKHGFSDQKSFWYSRRKWGEDEGVQSGKNGDLFLSFVDLNFNPLHASNQVIDVEVLCTNQNLPTKLPFGGGAPYLQLVDSGAPLKRVSCLMPFTIRRSSPAGKSSCWQLISHLSLNHLSLSRGEIGGSALREILKLYDFKKSSDTQAIIDSIYDVECYRTKTRSLRHSFNVFAQGTKIVIKCDEKQFTGVGLFLFTSVLERFLALYCSINSFVQLVVKTQDKEEEVYKWAPRAGEKVLL